jgi:macrolide transport system ATP-binding/permease protein
MSLHRDLVFGLRMLRKNSLLLIVASLSLGLGIGLNATVFSAVQAMLFRGPAVERTDELVNFYSRKEGVSDLNPNSYADFLDMRQRLRSVDTLVGYALATVSYERRGVPAVQIGAVVTSGYFDLLETRPELGRLFQDQDFADRAPVVVVSDKFWRDELEGSPSAIGCPIRIFGHVFDVVGVLPADVVGFSRGLVPDVFVPITQLAQVQPMGEQTADGQANGRKQLDWRGYRFLTVTGRLAPGATRAQAEAEASALARSLAQDYPDSNQSRGTVLRETRSVRFDPDLDAVLVPLAMFALVLVALVLVVACANVANLMLAKAQARGSEMALRTALGASRPQLLRQLLVESALYGVVCAGVGLLVAALAIRLVDFGGLDLPFEPHVSLRLDLPVLVFTFAVSLVTTLLFGLIPARHASRLSLVPLLRSTGTSTRPGRWWSPTHVLVIGQVAMSLMLVVVAGLMFRSVGVARGEDVGFKVQGLGNVLIGPGPEISATELPAVWRRIEDRVAALPGVAAVSLASRLPLGIIVSGRDLFIPGYRDTEADPAIHVDSTHVDEHYFSTLGLDLVAGRLIDSRDTPDTSPVAVVTQAMVRRFWPGESGPGKRFRVGASDGPEFEVVGVVRDYKIRSPGETARPFVHFAWNQTPHPGGSILFRSTGAPDRLLDQVVAAVRVEAPDAVVFQSTTMTRMRDLLLLPLRAGSVAAVSLGSLALFLAVLGLAGLIVYWVSRRTHEIGLRIALGAGRASVLRLVAGRAFVLIGVGLLLGAAGSVLLGRLVQPVLYVAAFDPLSLAIGVGVLLLAGVLASIVPARRAAAIDPMTVLRQE